MYSPTRTRAQGNTWVATGRYKDSGEVLSDGPGDFHVSDLCLHFAYSLTIQNGFYNWVPTLVALQYFYLFTLVRVTYVQGHCEAVELGVG